MNLNLIWGIVIGIVAAFFLVCVMLVGIITTERVMKSDCINHSIIKIEDELYECKIRD